MRFGIEGFAHLTVNLYTCISLARVASVLILPDILGLTAPSNLLEPRDTFFWNGMYTRVK